MAKTFIAISKQIPVIGKRYDCTIISCENEKFYLKKMNTSPVRCIQPLGDNTYYVITHNNVYITKVMG